MFATIPINQKNCEDDKLGAITLKLVLEVHSQIERVKKVEISTTIQHKKVSHTTLNSKTIQI